MNIIQDESGATAIEYGLIAALVAIIIVAGLSVLGGALAQTYGTVANAVTNP